MAMTNFQISKTSSILKWVLSISTEKHLKPSKSPFSERCRAFYPVKIPFCYITISLFSSQHALSEVGPTPGSQTVSRNSNTHRTEAQAALLDYFHCTKGLNFFDAEHMSMNSPIFLRKLIKNIENEKETRQALARFLQFHPINEFEAFFESLGLEPFEVSALLPCDSIYLSNPLLTNVHVLCNYGIPRSKVGRIYKEAAEVFRYEGGVLGSKIQAYEKLGLSKASTIKLIVSSPSLLIGDVNTEFVKILLELKSLGIDYDRILGHFSEKNSYDWNKMLGTLHFLSQMGYSKEELGGILIRNSGFLLDGSGSTTYSLIGLLLKLSVTMKEIMGLFLQFPCVQVSSFVENLRQGLKFMIEIEMEAEEIGNIVRSHPQVLGSCSLKKPNSLFAKLNVGKKRLCGIIKEDPNQLKNWVLGSKISRLPKSNKDQISLMQKTAFFMSLGFAENSDEMKRALKVCRGKSVELQERFDCLVNAGLKWNDASNMIKVTPQILNQSRDLIEKKISFLVNCVSYPLESLVAFPLYVSYTIERVKLRYLMYNWLKDEGMVSPALALSTVLACSDKTFILRFVNRHPKGPEVWEKFRKELSSG
ncbi:transcription termination factor MTEF18, mitochondrial-like [Magnolia sinica]|uniref:transcription termination factor MTEF18, mitochondrial-like n=1 Tax=Magnolia sinica TaxID=86752 RepID=UPI0026580AC0|nr:transcription termination factor MTEF18, mitochondrial-like [Magnolia sinica]